jgi:hypothetical protein
MAVLVRHQQLLKYIYIMIGYTSEVPACAIGEIVYK